ncbi:MAG: hypothetical protein QOJ27_1970 [Sphingomonadales bacterium]|nr:hypothetical protein [Sphingomonadales bacterium]
MRFPLEALPPAEEACHVQAMAQLDFPFGAWLAILLALASAPAAGAEFRAQSMSAHSRLAPIREPSGVLADYEADVRRVFREGFAAGVMLRAIVRPSFSEEYAVGLRRTQKGYEIFALQPSRQIWAYQAIRLYKRGRAGVIILDDPGPGGKSGKRAELLGDPGAALRDGTAEEVARLEKDLPADPGDLPLERCAAAVDDGAAAALTAAWRRMLDAVRPDEDLMPGLDGTSFHFSMEADGRRLAGEAWSPQEGTRPARLARLAEAMRDYCGTREGERLAEIRALAESLGRAETGG